MKILRFCAYVTLSVLAYLYANADVLEQFKNRASTGLKEFREDKYQELEFFRRNVNEEIAKFMSQPWTLVKVSPKLDLPIDPSPEPVHIDMDTVKRKDSEPVKIKRIINTAPPTPQPQPVEPIIEIDPKPDESIADITPVINEDYLEVQFYGTNFSVRRPDLSGYTLNGNNPAGFADAWRSLNNTSTNNLIIDCLEQRDNKALCDWAYMQLIQEISRYLFPDNQNKATLLSGFLLSQCGYRIRFATDSQNHLHLLYSPTGVVYLVPSFDIANHTYYIADEFDKNDLHYKICDFKCPGERDLSFEITRAMQLDYTPATTREIKMHNHPEITLSVTTNRNLIDFYNSYPVATTGDNMYSQWAIYANTPVSPELRRDLYPVLKEIINGKTQKEAANILIHLAESFPYGYDNQIWGRDRAFFMDESWYYPYSDCEDHAINFTRLIRDLLGLEALLVCYPNHLASAVAFTDTNIEGDYIIHRGKRFIICDPTIFYADVGVTMTGCDNESAVLIDLISDN